MDDGPYWVILLMYGSHEMRHIGFPQVDSGQRDSWVGASQFYSAKKNKKSFETYLGFF